MKLFSNTRLGDKGKGTNDPNAPSDRFAARSQTSTITSSDNTTQQKENPIMTNNSATGNAAPLANQNQGSLGSGAFSSGLSSAVQGLNNPLNSAAASGLAKNRVQTKPSVLSSDLKIKGNISTSGNIMVEGAVEGDIHAHLLTIGDSATIKGEVIGDDVIINGTVNGRIRGVKVRLSATARVQGDIIHKTIAIEAGAQFEGGVQRQSDPLSNASSAKGQSAAVARKDANNSSVLLGKKSANVLSGNTGGGAEPTPAAAAAKPKSTPTHTLNTVDK